MAPRRRQGDRNGGSDAVARSKQTRETIVNVKEVALWVITRLAEGGLPVIGKALVAGAVGWAARYFWG